MKRTIVTITALTAAALSFTAPSHADGGRTIKPCKYEDSVSCVWDAKHMGNGLGSSYIADSDGTPIRVSHRVAHALTH